jgi:hypothetical protein
MELHANLLNLGWGRPAGDSSPALQEALSQGVIFKPFRKTEGLGTVLGKGYPIMRAWRLIRRYITDSAVRITHLPTGMVVTCQDEKSQHKNKAKALKVLYARLLEKARQEQADVTSAARRSQIGSGDRSERIRTYNFPQSRLTDHRIGLTLYRLPEIMAGDLDEVVDALAQADRAEKLGAI